MGSDVAISNFRKNGVCLISKPRNNELSPNAPDSLAIELGSSGMLANLFTNQLKCVFVRKTHVVSQSDCDEGLEQDCIEIWAAECEFRKERNSSWVVR